MKEQTERKSTNFNSGLRSSETAEWFTPQELYDRLNSVYNFTLDPCATPENAKCARYFTKAENGLAQSWAGETVFMNPPYGREIQKWIDKAYWESVNGATVVCLIPARTDTAYWHDIIFPYASKIEFLPGRLYFTRPDGFQGRAPFPSAVVVFRGKHEL